ncbi:hypothetical protein H5410_041170 [Solanum commersonii]|uniref:Uncharacterized protein n=1 Tax=Solanum commersonii TaxID=4109 RepID=A0A9J5XU17_SOLCO|nr:hypothetical protein H5410_041170 [Solanum commersonii]
MSLNLQLVMFNPNPLDSKHEEEKIGGLPMYPQEYKDSALCGVDESDVVRSCSIIVSMRGTSFFGYKAI